MAADLEILLPWKLLSSLHPNSSHNYTCSMRKNKNFKLHVTRESDDVVLKFSGSFSRDGPIHVTKFKEDVSKTKDSVSTRSKRDSGLVYQHNTRSVTTSQAVTIHKFEHGDDSRPKRKRKRKNDDDYVPVDSVGESDDDDIAESSNEEVVCKVLADYVTVEETGSGSLYTCLRCHRTFDSMRRVVCHLEDHGGFRPWQCSFCEFEASFLGSLVRHVAKTHEHHTAKRLKTASQSDVFNTSQSSQKLTDESGDVMELQEVDDLNDSTVIDANTKTLAIEIEIRSEEPDPLEGVSDVVLNEQAGGTIEMDIQHSSIENEPENESTDFTVLQLPNEPPRVPPNVDPRLYKIAKNYKAIIDEYCQLVDDHFQCKLCSATFVKRNQFMDHLYKTHEDCQPYYCLLCDFRTRGKPNVFTHNVYKHSSKDKPYSCECGSAFFTKTKYMAHKATHEGKAEFTCEQCDGLFATKTGLGEHVKRVHGAKLFKCDQCDKTFSTAFSLKIHSNVHQPGRNWKCNYCQKLYRSEQSLKVHMHSHTTVFHCQICDKDIYSYSAFISHRNLHDPKSRKHPCTVCERLFPSKKALVKHVLVHHSELTFEHKCQICDKSFKLLEQLNSHMICHSNSKPWVCEVCKQAFKRQSTLCTHRNRHGRQNRAPFVCTFCRLEFNSYPELAEHLIRQEKAGLCQICHRLFSSKPLLDQHMASAHHREQNSDPSGSTLQEYLAETEATSPIQAEAEEGVSIIGDSSAFNYGQQIIISGLHETPIQIAPTRVKTKVIHSGQTSSVVAQIKTTPVIERAKFIPLVNSANEIQSSASVPQYPEIQTLKLTNLDGEVIDVPIIDAVGTDEEIIELVETG